MSHHSDPEANNGFLRVSDRSIMAQGCVETGLNRYSGDYADIGPTGSFLEYWRVLRRRKGLLATIALTSLAIGVLITLPQAPVYQARTSLEIQSINQEFLNIKQLTPVSDTVVDAWSNDIQTHIKLLQSEVLAKRVAARLTKAPPRPLALHSEWAAAWRRVLKLPEPALADAMDRAIRQVRASLKLRAAGQTRVIEILCDSTDATLAADYANALADEYIGESMDARWKMNQRTTEWLTRQMDDLRIKLERSEDQLQRYARTRNLVFTGDKDKQNISEQRLRHFQEELSKAQGDRIAKQSRYEMARGSPPDALPDVLNDASIREYQVKLTDLRRQEAELGTTYQPEYSKLQRIKAQIATLDGALVRERQAIVQRIRNEYEEAQQREKLLETDYAAQSRVVTADSEKAIQYNILQREVDSTRQLYESILQRVKESAIASAMHASNVRVVDPASPPSAPYKPSAAKSGIFGLALGLFAGITVVMLRERADRTLQAPGDAQLYMDVPELGVVPEAHTIHRKRSLRAQMESRQPAHAHPLALNGDYGTTQPQLVELITLQNKLSMEADAFRVVLTAILFSGENGSRPRVLALTSCGPSEGKSTVASNLAIALAEIRSRVLLIDADLRKSRVHEIFGVKNDRGLSTLLEARHHTDEMLKEAVQETSIKDLFVLPAGPSVSTSLLFSPALPELISRFKREFDMVLVDTPPVLHMSDARVVGRHADAAVLIIRAGKTTRDSAVAARGQLAEDGTRVLGTVLNDWKPLRHPLGYSYYGYGGKRR
jgi:succinoglycan biosynthesis transport protein ExoP